MYIDGIEQNGLKTGKAGGVSLKDAAGLLPTCTDIVAVTSSATSVMTTTGRYQGVHTQPSTQFERQGLRLYLHDQSAPRAAYSPADHAIRQPPSITFASADSATTHRAYLTQEADADKAVALAKTLSHNDSGKTGKPCENDAPYLFSKAVDRQVIPHFLVYLAELRLPVTLASGTGHFTHSDQGAIDDVSENGDLLYVRSGDTTLSFDMTKIDGWRTRNIGLSPQPELILEASHANHGAAFYLAATHRACGHPREAWRRILTSLPASRC